jgi:hypothetical protein
VTAVRPWILLCSSSGDELAAPKGRPAFWHRHRHPGLAPAPASGAGTGTGIRGWHRHRHPGLAPAPASGAGTGSRSESAACLVVPYPRPESRPLRLRLAPLGGGACGASLDTERGQGRWGGMLQIQTLVIQFTSSLQPQLVAVESRDTKFADQLRRSLLCRWLESR